ncbi:nucleotidyl cyclase domain-containing protein [Konateibacter massiliensis]|uniref:diguanylate cyclase n=1 Tax=Konateibacter massiliensis TaxID=2002841 RepID=UPI000C14E5D3|nr:diguanylate cyclase [Konateibacter massiliensis]
MIKKRKTGYLLQDIGLVLFLLGVGAMAFTVGYAKEGLLLEFVIMLMAAFFAVLLAGFKLNSLSIVAVSFSVLGYTAYKIYNFFAYSTEIEPLCYIWIIFPIIVVAAMLIFVYGNAQTETENEVLREQVEELVMVNALTGMYNLRSLYNDLQKQAAYAQRNGMQISLMIIKLRYDQELRSILSRSHYEMLLQKMAEVTVDTVRVEDRVYSIDNYGSIGIILTCGMEGCEFAKKRIKARIESEETFQDITDSAIQVKVRVAYLEYKGEEYGNDMINFKQKVESELQYDV